MLLIVEYEFGWEALDAVVAKRLEWEELQPAGFHFIGEYIWHHGDPPFRGVSIIEAETTQAINAFVLHYGPTLRMSVHTATDVASGIAQLASTAPPAKRRKPTRR